MLLFCFKRLRLASAVEFARLIMGYHDLTNDFWSCCKPMEQDGHWDRGICAHGLWDLVTRWARKRE